MKKIDFEAHFHTKEYLEAMYRNTGYPRFAAGQEAKSVRLWYNEEVGQPYGDLLLKDLLNMGEERLARMDKCGIDIEVLSLAAPGLEQLDHSVAADLARKTNDSLSQVIKRFPGRFMGYAALAPGDPDAADELERCVGELDFKAWNTHSNYGDSYLDDKRYWPIMERCEKLKVPICVHPTVPAIPQIKGYGFALAGAPFGFGLETALCAMRLIFSGVFDAFPTLKIILGHLGEGLPFILKRIDWAYVRPFDPKARPTISKKPGEYVRTNFFVTTSGNYFEPAFRCTADALGLDRILLGTDYPYEDPEECIEFIEGLPLSTQEKEKIYSVNAAQIGIMP